MSELTTPDARLVDRSLTHVGERQGVARSALALGVHVLRRVLGLRRPFRYKVLPTAFALIAYAPALGFVALAALIPDEFAGEFLPTPADFYGFIITAIVLFVSLAGPQTLCPDRRHRTLGLYLASPLDRRTYLAANGAALAVVLFAVTLGPPLLVQAGLALLEVPGPAWIVMIWRVVSSGVVLSVLFGAVGLAGASFTDRPAFASAFTFVALLGLSTVHGVLVEALDLPAEIGLVDIIALGVESVSRLNGDDATLATVGTPVLAIGVVGWTVVLAAVVLVRYRRLEVVR